jgi:hypothetical protein
MKAGHGWLMIDTTALNLEHVFETVAVEFR